MQRFFLGVDALQQKRFQRAADNDADDGGGDRQRGIDEPRRPAGGSEAEHEAGGEIGAERIETAVRHVENAHDAENERHAHGDEEDERRIGDAVEDSQHDCLEGHGSAEPGEGCADAGAPARTIDQRCLKLLTGVLMKSGVSVLIQSSLFWPTGAMILAAGKIIMSSSTGKA